MRIERLVPAPVPNSGMFEGTGEPLRLLVMGDSTVAGVGMERLEDTLTFNIAKAAHELSGRPVRWRAAGGNSATAAHLRDYMVPHIEERDWTHIALSVGINDMKNFHAVRQFKRDFGTLLYALRSRYPHARIIWCPIPDMHQCPALPRTLGSILSARADLINAMGTRMCRERQATVTGPVPPQSPGAFARDGFHPNGEGYRSWGRHFARWIAPSRTRSEPAPPTEMPAVTPIRRHG